MLGDRYYNAYDQIMLNGTSYGTLVRCKTIEGRNIILNECEKFAIPVSFIGNSILVYDTTGKFFNAQIYTKMTQTRQGIAADINSMPIVSVCATLSATTETEDLKCNSISMSMIIPHKESIKTIITILEGLVNSIENTRFNAKQLEKKHLTFKNMLICCGNAYSTHVKKRLAMKYDTRKSSIFHTWSYEADIIAMPEIMRYLEQLASFRMPSVIQPHKIVEVSIREKFGRKKEL